MYKKKYVFTIGVIFYIAVMAVLLVLQGYFGLSLIFMFLSAITYSMQLM